MQLVESAAVERVYRERMKEFRAALEKAEELMSPYLWIHYPGYLGGSLSHEPLIPRERMEQIEASTRQWAENKVQAAVIELLAEKAMAAK